MLTAQFYPARFAYSQAQLRELERQKLQSYGAPRLMDCAAQAIANLAGHRLQSCPRGSSVLILAGPGNNGQDALLAMQLLQDRGWHCERLLGIDAESLQSLDRKLPEHGLVIDGWLGLGQNRALADALGQAVERVNQWRVQNSDRYCLSIDIPTGLHPDFGFPWPLAIMADDCLALIGPLRGLLTGEGRNYWKHLHLAPLCTEQVSLAEQQAQDFDPGRAVLEVDSRPHRLLNRISCFSKWKLANRTANAHKGLMGDVLLIGGACGMQGALRLAAEGSLAIGSGKCFVFSLASSSRDTALPAQVLHLQPDALQAACESGSKMVLAIGCGLGLDASAKHYLSEAIESSMDLVIDADAINLLAMDPHLIDRLAASMRLDRRPQTPEDRPDPKPRRRRVVLTPHPLEAARLLGQSRGSVERDRFTAIRRLAALSGCTVILKGAGSLVHAPEREIMIIDRSAPALAQAGSGDMLCGVLAALMARHPALDPQLLAATAAFMHAEAAAIWSLRHGRFNGMRFEDLARSISELFAQLG